LVFDEEEGRGTVDNEPGDGTEDNATDEEVELAEGDLVGHVLLPPVLSAKKEAARRRSSCVRNSEVSSVFGLPIFG
jgi:hypothetical protein